MEGIVLFLPVCVSVPYICKQIEINKKYAYIGNIFILGHRTSSLTAGVTIIQPGP